MSKKYTSQTAALKTVTHDTAVLNAKKILKNNSEELTKEAVMNMSESDARYAQLHAPNTFEKPNTFEEANTFVETVETQKGIKVTGGNIEMSEGGLIEMSEGGLIEFTDLVNGTVTEQETGASGYIYMDCTKTKPTSWNNGICYDFGEVGENLDLASIRFSSISNKLVQTCEIWFKTATGFTLTAAKIGDFYWIDNAEGKPPTLLANKHYRLVFRREPFKHIASIAYVY